MIFAAADSNDGCAPHRQRNRNGLPDSRARSGHDASAFVELAATAARSSCYFLDRVDVGHEHACEP
jgi:hypothetical protein